MEKSGRVGRSARNPRKGVARQRAKMCVSCVCVCVCVYNFRKTAACRTAARKDSASEESLRTVLNKNSHLIASCA